MTATITFTIYTIDIDTEKLESSTSVSVSIGNPSEIISDAYTKSEADARFAAISHTHTRNEITDFPESMPASDVYDWAKAESKPSYTASEIADGESNVSQKISDLSLKCDGKITEPTSEGTSGQALVTDGNGGRSWATIESGYVKPTDGIPLTDLTETLQTSISRADEIYDDYIATQNIM